MADNKEDLEKLMDICGVDVKVHSEGGAGSWAVLLVTPIMRRAQQLESSSEVIFVDSTASCDSTRSSVTTQGNVARSPKLTYNAAKLLPPKAPETFMTHNSAAEKAAILEHWPEARQLLCHFYVAQAEWQWLAPAKHGVSPSERKSLMAIFQKIMDADSKDTLETAKQDLYSQQHKGFITHVVTLLEREEEWVLLFRLSTKTRGHNTNNYSEASIRVLKDIILHRTRAFNVVTLAEFLSVVWEKYFFHRILDHAHSRITGHMLLYERLLKKLPKDTEKNIRCNGDGHYVVPSGSSPDSKLYTVYSDIGLCTCRSGQQGAFCKHQALVHKVFGGIFPNAPLLTIEARYNLGKLALGDNCPGIDFFEGLHETQVLQNAACSKAPTDALDCWDTPSTSTAPTTQYSPPESRETSTAQLMNQVSCDRLLKRRRTEGNSTQPMYKE
ncbi:uncharacterized protein LOC144121335 [Amblyomma americanum]